MQQTWTPLNWASEHWTQLSIGAVVIGFLWRSHRLLSKIKAYIKGWLGTQDSVELIKTNHLPHLQAELEKANGTLSGIREDNRELRADLRALLVARNQ